MRRIAKRSVIAIFAMTAWAGVALAEGDQPEAPRPGSPAEQAAGQIKLGAQQIGQGAAQMGEGIRQGAIEAWEALKAGAAAAIDKFNGRQTAAAPNGSAAEDNAAH